MRLTGQTRECCIVYILPFAFLLLNIWLKGWERLLGCNGRCNWPKTSNMCWRFIGAGLCHVEGSKKKESKRFSRLLNSDRQYIPAASTTWKFDTSVLSFKSTLGSISHTLLRLHASAMDSTSFENDQASLDSTFLSVTISKVISVA